MHPVEHQVEESPLVSPLLHSWARACMAKAPALSVPTGFPVVTVAGPDPDRILVIGGGPASGIGAPDHDAALPGRLARALQARTGRGATVESRGAPMALLEHLPRQVAQVDLQRFDVVVVFIGLEDGASGAPPRRWRRDLVLLLEQMQQDSGDDVLVLLMRIPPASTVPLHTGPRVKLADWWITRLNRIAADIARDREHVVDVTLPPVQPGRPPGSPDWYERCAQALADLLTPPLNARAGFLGA